MILKMIKYVSVLVYLWCYGVSTLPKRLPGTVIGDSHKCHQDTMKPTEHFQRIKSALNQISSVLTSRYGPPCGCGENWRKIIDLDLANQSHSCPSGWRFVDNSSVRGCGRSSGACSSSVFSTDLKFSKVCGRINAIQFGTPDGFYNAVYGIGMEGPYIDGISITYRSSLSRKHIWSFVAANSERSPHPSERCPCSDTNSSWPFSIPSFVGSNYFCDSGQERHTYTFRYFSDNPLWDGDGCSQISSCCTQNSPPWFCTNVSDYTSNAIEVRICGNQAINAEDIVVTRMELYVQ